MTRTEMTKFGLTLKTKRAELEDASANRSALMIHDSADELDRIQHGQERELAIVTLDRKAKLLQEVRAALARVDAGTFGVCVECEEAIGIRRLAAVPWAASCISCQEAAESRVSDGETMNADLLVDAGSW